MSLQIATVVSNIAALTVANVDILDTDKTPTAVTTRANTSILMPLPAFITEPRMERDSFGGGSVAKMTMEYRLNYRFFLAPCSTYRNNTLAWLPDLVERVAAILDEVLAIDTLGGCVDIVPGDVTNMGVVNDPSDVAFYGCDMQFIVTEFIN